MKHDSLAFSCEHVYRTEKNSDFLNVLYSYNKEIQEEKLDNFLFSKTETDEKFWCDFFDNKSPLTGYKQELLEDINKRIERISKYINTYNIDPNKLLLQQKKISFFGQFVFVQQEFEELNTAFKEYNNFVREKKEILERLLSRRSIDDVSDKDITIVESFYKSMRNTLVHGFNVESNSVNLEFEIEERKIGSQNEGYIKSVLPKSEEIEESIEITSQIKEKKNGKKEKYYSITCTMKLEKFKRLCNKYVSEYRENFGKFIRIDLDEQANIEDIIKHYNNLYEKISNNQYVIRKEDLHFSIITTNRKKKSKELKKELKRLFEINGFSNVI